MDPQSQSLRAQFHEQGDLDRHTGVGDHDHDHDNEKKSVLKKVKAKAKKLKDSLIGQSHDHDHDEHNINDDNDEDDHTMMRGSVVVATSHVPCTNLPLQQPPTILVVDPHTAATNYNTPTTHPRPLHGGETQPSNSHNPPGGQDNPVLESFDKKPVLESFDEKLSFNDEPVRPQTNYDNLPFTGTGTHNQFSAYDHDTEPILPVTGTPHIDEGGSIHSFAPEEVLPRKSSVPVEWEEDVDRAADDIPCRPTPAEDGNKPLTATATEYGKKMVEKLSPVYEKVAGAGSAVMSKIQGTGRAEEEGQDKGVSVREYITEKLRPGEEDKALSEAISGALQRKKEEMGKKNEEALGKDELEKVAERVTESEEVKRRLGTGEENKWGQKVTESYVNSPGNSVVDKLRGAMGSWLGTVDTTDHTQSQSHPVNKEIDSARPPM